MLGRRYSMALDDGAPRRKETVLQFEGVTLVAALLHQIRRGFAERCNNVAAPLVNQGELFYFYWPAITLADCRSSRISANLGPV